MKKFYSGLFVVALAMLSACQTKTTEIALPEQELGKTVFTASLGADTKTYLEYDADRQIYKNLWDAGDEIYIMAYDENDVVIRRNFAKITGGAGTNTATFASDIENGARYVAVYGYGLQDENYTIYPQISPNQWMRFDGKEGAYTKHYPMYAESENKNFTFKNLAAFLKIELTGNTRIETIKVESNSPDVALSGCFALSFDENGNPQTEVVDSTAGRYVTYSIGATLSETEPMNCYIVVPAQTCYGGLTITYAGPEGSMVKTYNQDITFGRSQIRTIHDVSFVVEHPNSWGLVGDLTDWGDDILLEPAGDGTYILSDIYLTPDNEFKFRANGDWDINFGLLNEYAVNPDELTPLCQSGYNIRVSEEGNYDIILDPANGTAIFNLPDRIVDCENWDEVAALDNDTYVRVRGIVFGICNSGFMFNIGNYYGNTIQVYTRSQPIDYVPVLGNVLEIVAKKITYAGLPELVFVESCTVLDDTETDYGFGGYYYDLTNPEVFDSTQLDRSEYVYISGTLEHSGNYWNLIVDGATRVGSIIDPIIDLTEYVGQKILIQGWYCGLTGANGKYLNVMMKNLIPSNSTGDIEDILPGGDIIELPEIY